MIDPYLVSILFKYIKPYMSSNPMIPGTRPVAMEPLPRPPRVDNGVDNGVDDVVIMVDPRYWWSNTDPIDWWPCFEVHEASIVAGWWLVYLPLWKMMDFVSWDDYIFPIWWESHNSCSSHHQESMGPILLALAGHVSSDAENKRLHHPTLFFVSAQCLPLLKPWVLKFACPNTKKNIFRWMMFLSLKLLETDCFWNEHVWMHV